MTREEKIELKAAVGRLMYTNNKDIRDYNALIKFIDVTRHSPTREQVEKVWKGEWINKHSAYDHKIFTCAQCGKQISIQGENLDFCPKCGSAQTDEAVDIIMQRFEVLKNE